jgi:predicted branched-subunit amino acid permease
MHTAREMFRRGAIKSLPFLIVMIPFAMLFGVVATEAGMDVAQVIGFSVLVLAGASQFTAVQLLSDNASVIIVILSCLAVNLRMAMYSAALAPYLGAAPLWQRALAAYALFDSSYACASQAYARNPDWSVRERMLYFAGAAGPAVPMWLLLTLLGSGLGAAIPAWLALDFAVPICFLAMVAPALKTLPQVAAAVTSVTLALLLAWVPYSLGLLVAAALAMGVGAEVERRLAQRQVPA